MSLCLKVLKESNKTKFNSYGVRNSAGLSRARFSPTTFLEIAVNKYNSLQQPTTV